MLARIGVMRALHQNVERVFNPDRKGLHYRALARPSLGFNQRKIKGGDG
jgi:hypothetical protein